MQKENYVRQRSGARAIALDNRAELVRIRLLLLFTLLLSTISAWGFHLLFAH